jgi:hypothetical protein
MKATMIFSALSVIMIYAANFVYANHISDPNTTDKAQLITYIVKVNFVPNFQGTTYQFVLAITDEKGRYVVSRQFYHPGISTYTFTEAGSFRGTRIAIMVPYPGSQSGWAIPPVVMKATFFGGKAYDFNLSPVAIGLTGGREQ